MFRAVIFCFFLGLIFSSTSSFAADIKPCVEAGGVNNALEPCAKLIENHDNGTEILSQKDLIWVINNHGRALHWQDRLDELSKDIDRVFALDPKNNGAIFNRFLLHNEREEWELALKDINWVINANYNDINYNLYARAGVYNGLGRYEDAIVDLDKAIARDDSFPYMHFERGLAYKNLEKYELAIEDFSTFIETSPNGSQAYVDRALSYLNSDQPVKMLADAKANLEINPNDSYAYSILGIALRHNNQETKAIEAYKKVLEFDPQDDQAYFNMSLAHRDLYQYDLAVEALKSAIEINPNNYNAYLKLGDSFEKLNELENASETYAKLSKIDPQNDEALSARLRLLKRQNSFSCKWLSLC